MDGNLQKYLAFVKTVDTGSFTRAANVRFTTWEDYAILSMAEKGLGIGILPQTILQRIPYEVEIRPLRQPYYRKIGLAMKDRAHLSPAAKKFLEYLPCREEDVGHTDNYPL